MGAFAIFAFVLTGIYLGYYTVVIFMDLYGENMKSKKSDSEIISVSDEEEHQSVMVNETENGYTTGDQPASSVKEQISEESPSEDESSVDDDKEQPVPSSSETEAHKLERQYNTSAEPISPEWEKEYDADDFANLLVESAEEDYAGILLTRTIK